jgi:hypothetical protein
MDSVEVIKKLAFIQCDDSDKRPCPDCVIQVEEEINSFDIIDPDLIETTAIAISNNSRNYDAYALTPLELMFAFTLLIDIVPAILDRVKDEPSGS